MRFEVELCILCITQEVISVSSTRSEGFVTAIQRIERDKRIITHIPIPSTRYRNRFSSTLSTQSFRPSSTSDGILVNQSHKGETLTYGSECNPQSDNPDTGILSCGIGSYCMESGDSALGGKCKMDMLMKDHPMSASSRRSLKQSNAFHFFNGTNSPTNSYHYGNNSIKNSNNNSNSNNTQGYLNSTGLSPKSFCSGNNTYRNLECDCSGINFMTQTGSLYCFGFTPYCLPPPQDNACLSAISLSVIFRPGGSYYLEECYTFVTPRPVVLCYAFDSEVPGMLQRCSVDTQTCNSCRNMKDGRGTTKSACFEFNCSNTMLMLTGGGRDAIGTCRNNDTHPIIGSLNITNAMNQTYNHSTMAPTMTTTKTTTTTTPTMVIDPNKTHVPSNQTPFPSIVGPSQPIGMDPTPAPTFKPTKTASASVSITSSTIHCYGIQSFFLIITNTIAITIAVSILLT